MPNPRRVFNPRKSFRATGVKIWSPQEMLDTMHYVRPFEESVGAAVNATSARNMRELAARVRENLVEEGIIDGGKKRKSGVDKPSAVRGKARKRSPALRSGGKAAGPSWLNRSKQPGPHGDPLGQNVAWRPDETPDRRLGALNANRAGPRKAAGNKTLLSRSGYGRSTFQTGILGYSSERVRGAREVMMNPRTRLMQSLPIYLAYEAGRFANQWLKNTGADWRESLEETTDKLAKGGGTLGMLKKAVVGTYGDMANLAGDAVQAVILSGNFGVPGLIGAAVPSWHIPARLAQLADYLGESTAHLVTPGNDYSSHPLNREVTEGLRSGARYRDLRSQAYWVGRQLAEEKLDRFIDNGADLLYARGVTNLRAFKNELRNMPHIQRWLDEMGSEARSHVRAAGSGNIGTMLRDLIINRPDVAKHVKGRK